MENFKEVSLGFAEFVSQLLQETFEAVLSAQNFQIEKYHELAKALSLPNEIFVEQFISETQLLEKEIDFFGFQIKKHMGVDKAFEDFLIAQFETLDRIVHSQRLTTEGYENIKSFIVNLLVEEKKEILNQLLNQSNAKNLIVDSGQITAKLELSNLYSSNGETDISKIAQGKSSKESVTQVNVPNLIGSRLQVPIYEIRDDITNKTTILIDKSAIIDASRVNLSIPTVRLIAKPIKMSSASNLFTEVKINFKTV